MSMDFKTMNAFAEENSVYMTEDQSLVLSYTDVFEYYYEQAYNQLQEENIGMPFTLEQFSEGYYTHDMDIVEYTQTVVEYVRVDIENIEQIQNSSNVQGDVK